MINDYMEKINRRAYISLTVVAALFSAALVSSLDWNKSWFEPAAVFALFVLAAGALVNFKKTALFLIALLPGLASLNVYKINIAAYLPPLKYYNLPVNLLAIACAAIIILGLIAIIANPAKAKKIPLKTIITLYSFYVAISVFWSVDKADSLSGVIYFLTPFAIYALAYIYFTEKKDLLEIISFSIISSLWPAIIAISQIITGDFFFEPDSSLKRLKGPFTHPNLFGLYLFLVLSLAVSFFLARRENRLGKNKLLAAAALLSALGLVLTYSRVSWASFAVFLLFVMHAKKSFLIFISLAAPLAAAAGALVESLRFRVMELFSSTIFNSWIARKNIWQVAWSETLKKPIFGHGIGSAEAVIEAAKPWKGGSSIPHNDFMLYALELGIVGAALFAAYFLGAVHNVYRVFKEAEDKYTVVEIFNRKFEINFRILFFCLLAILLATVPAMFFESTSRRIINQVIVWAILGSLFNFKKEKENA